MTSYADPSNLAQITPGELSKDQAVPSFYYIDKNKDKFLLRWAYLLFPTGECFWDSVGTSLTVGSYITCEGYAGTTGLKLSLLTNTRTGWLRGLAQTVCLLTITLAVQRFNLTVVIFLAQICFIKGL